MATKEQTTFENPYSGYAESATNAVKEVWGWQIKTAQSMFDQGLRVAQTWADFSQTQFQEGSKVTNELMKMGLQNSAELKKSFYGISEKVFSAQK